MKSKIKKFIASALAATMLFSVSAFAALGDIEVDVNGTLTKIASYDPVTETITIVDGSNDPAGAVYWTETGSGTTLKKGKETFAYGNINISKIIDGIKAPTANNTVPPTSLKIKTDAGTGSITLAPRADTKVEFKNDLVLKVNNGDFRGSFVMNDINTQEFKTSAGSLALDVMFPGSQSWVKADNKILDLKQAPSGTRFDIRIPAIVSTVTGFPTTSASKKATIAVPKRANGPNISVKMAKSADKTDPDKNQYVAGITGFNNANTSRYTIYAFDLGDPALGALLGLNLTNAVDHSTGRWALKDSSGKAVKIDTLAFDAVTRTGALDLTSTKTFTVPAGFAKDKVYDFGTDAALRTDIVNTTDKVYLLAITRNPQDTNIETVPKALLYDLRTGRTTSGALDVDGVFALNLVP